MLRYILKRVLIFIPTLLIISLLTFVISINTPGDPVELMLSSSSRTEGSLSSSGAGQQAYLQKRKELGLHLPVFYFSISTAASPDTLYKIYPVSHREMLEDLINKYGNWGEISKYYLSLNHLEQQIYKAQFTEGAAEAAILLKNEIYTLYNTSDAGLINVHLEKIYTTASAIDVTEIAEAADRAAEAFSLLKENPDKILTYLPSFQWHGFDNQYHRWMFGGNGSEGFIAGDFGTSYKSKRPVSEEIGEAVSITLQLSLLAALITYLIAVPLGIFSAVKKGSVADQSITTFLFVLYSLPAFWIGTLMIIFFGGGDFLDWFPPYGLGEIYPETSAWEAVKIRMHHLILPMICLVYPSFAYLSRQTRGGALSVLNQDYIRTAWAKGLPAKKVIWKHTFRNSLLPVITIFAGLFPQLIAGSVIVEIVFSIPGMGKLTLEAFYARNYPIIYTIVMLSAILSMAGFLIADILYAFADPRISYSKKEIS